MIMTVNAALAAGNISWPDPIGSTYSRFSNSSYSSVARSLRNPTELNPISFEFEISKIYAYLAEDQQDLGAEFIAIWDANLDVLYEV